MQEIKFCNQTILTYSPDLLVWTSNVKLTKLFCKLCRGGKQDKTSSADDWTNRWCVNNVRGLMGKSESVFVWFDASTHLSATQSDPLDGEHWLKLLVLIIKLRKELTEYYIRAFCCLFLQKRKRYLTLNIYFHSLAYWFCTLLLPFNSLSWIWAFHRL